MRPLVIAYRQRWVIREGEEDFRAHSNPSVEVPVATSWNEQEMLNLAKEVEYKGYHISWESVPCRRFSSAPRSLPERVYVRFDSLFIDKRQENFWQLASPLAVEYFPTPKDLHLAMREDAESENDTNWDHESIIEFQVPWSGRFSRNPFTVDIKELADSTVRLSQ